MNKELVPLFIAMVTTAGGILGLIVQQYFSNKAADERAKEHRAQTQADIELSKAAAAQLSIQLALETQRSTHVIQTAIATSAEQVQKDIRANTKLTAETKMEARAAYTEANTVNQKLLEIGVQMRDGQPLSSDEKKKD